MSVQAIIPTATASAERPVLLALAARPGGVTARVADILSNGLVRFVSPSGQSVDLSVPTPLKLGASVTIAAQGKGSGSQVTVTVQQTANGSIQTAQPTQAAQLAQASSANVAQGTASQRSASAIAGANGSIASSSAGTANAQTSQNTTPVSAQNLTASTAAVTAQAAPSSRAITPAPGLVQTSVNQGQSQQPLSGAAQQSATTTALSAPRANAGGASAARAATPLPTSSASQGQGSLPTIAQRTATTGGTATQPSATAPARPSVGSVTTALSAANQTPASSGSALQNTTLASNLSAQQGSQASSQTSATPNASALVRPGPSASIGNLLTLVQTLSGAAQTLSGGAQTLGQSGPNAQPQTNAFQAPALAQARQAAIGNQSSLAPLLAAIAPQRPAAQPAPTSQKVDTFDQAIKQIMSFKLNLRSVPSDPKGLSNILQRSGLLHESSLAKGLLPNQSPQPNLKQALLQLRQFVPTGEPTSDDQQSQAQRYQSAERSLPLPGAGKLGATQRLPNGAPPLQANAIPTAGQADAIEGALNRIRLHQMASLPAAEQTRDPQSNQPMREWVFEFPATLGQETAIIPFRIAEEDANGQYHAERAWTLEFAIDFEETGPVSAKVVLFGRHVTASITVERGEVAETLQETQDSLSAGLEAAGLTLARLTIKRVEEENA